MKKECCKYGVASANRFFAVFAVLFFFACVPRAAADAAEFPKGWKVKKAAVRIGNGAAYQKDAREIPLLTTGAAWYDRINVPLGFFTRTANRLGDVLVRKSLDESWPQGTGLYVYPISGQYFVLESVWPDAGSGDMGDHNLYLVDLDRNKIIGGVDQGGLSALSASVEVILNVIGVLTWEYPWWNRGPASLIIASGYFLFFMISFMVHDMEKMRNKIMTVGGILAADAVCLLIFGCLFKWI